MTVLVLYATTEGQTRKIARRAADHLTACGHTVELLPAAEAGALDLSRYDRALLLASVHAGRYQPDFTAFVASHRAELARLPTAFLSVSLSAGSGDPGDREGLAEVARKMQEETGWTPGRVEHVAGAFRWTEYNILESWAMRWIASRRDQTVRPGEDKEYTDWDALFRFLNSWASHAPLARSA
jgi:menaquinone-dependent protoporphyrinogen oxidase